MLFYYIDSELTQNMAANKTEYLSVLSKALKDAKASNIPSILKEYEAYFARKEADGFSEQDAIAKLEDPLVIAQQFSPEYSRRGRAPSIMVVIGLIIASLFAFCFFIFLYAWAIILAAFAAAVAVIGICLMLGANIKGYIPYIPPIESILLSISFIALTVLIAIVIIYCFLYAKRLLHIYCRWVHNVFSCRYAPPLSKHPPLKPKLVRKLRDTSLFSATVFASFFAAAIVILCLHTQSITFWHALGW